MTVDPREVRELPPLRPRARESHKGDFGRVLIAAGSPFMPGAAALAAQAAYRSGAGLVTILTDPPNIGAIAPAVVEAIFTDWTAIGERLALGEPIPYDAVLVGPGLGTADRGRLVVDLIEAASGPTIIDADALNVIARDRPALTRREDRIWTPHPGEFFRLTDERPRSDEERLASARRFVEACGGVLMLKGHRTVVLSAERYAINSTGNPGMATAGSGDVLAGIAAALLGQGYSPFDAARLAAHVHGLSGDLAAAALGEISTTAGDLVRYLPGALRQSDAESAASSTYSTENPGRKNLTNDPTKPR